MNKTATVSSVKYTKEMEKAIEDYRVSHLMTREQLYKKVWLKGKRSTIKYWEVSGKISFNSIKAFKNIWLDLSPYIR